jgi:hypothetical protein
MELLISLAIISAFWLFVHWADRKAVRDQKKIKSKHPVASLDERRIS